MPVCTPGKLQAIVTAPIVSGMCNALGTLAWSVALNGASEAPKSTVFACIAEIPPPLPIDWQFTCTLGFTDVEYWVIIALSNGQGNVAPAPVNDTGDGVGVGVGLGVAVGVGVGDAVEVGVLVGEDVGVAVGLGFVDAVGVGVGVGCCTELEFTMYMQLNTAAITITIVAMLRIVYVLFVFFPRFGVYR